MYVYELVLDDYDYLTLRVLFWKNVGLPGQGCKILQWLIQRDHLVNNTQNENVRDVGSIMTQSHYKWKIPGGDSEIHMRKLPINEVITKLGKFMEEDLK